MEGPPAGFREVEHTADWELEVWAPDLASLIKQAALGMYALSGARLAGEPRISHILELESPDAESLLVSFLSELLYLGEQEGSGFDTFELRLDGLKLHARLSGAPVVARDKEIKAITFHRLKIRETADGLRVNIVMDV